MSVTASRIESPIIKTASDTLVIARSCLLYWLTASCGGTTRDIQIDDDGTVKFDADLPANSVTHFAFDPPIRFKTDLGLVISSTGVTLTIGAQ